jgi:DNA-binding NtrC family response regulator
MIDPKHPDSAGASLGEEPAEPTTTAPTDWAVPAEPAPVDPVGPVEPARGSRISQARAKTNGVARILVVDDDQHMCELVEERLKEADFEVLSRLSAHQAMEALEEQDFDAIVTDLSLEGTSGIELCQHCRENRPNVPVIVITGFGNMESAIRAIRAGAADFISKPLDMVILEHALERALRDRHLREQMRRLKQADVQRTERFGALIGTSRAMQVVYDLIRRVAATDTTVLLSGEAGRGRSWSRRHCTS